MDFSQVCNPASWSTELRSVCFSQPDRLINWQCVKIAGIYGCSSHKNGINRYWSIPNSQDFRAPLPPQRFFEPAMAAMAWRHSWHHTWIRQAAAKAQEKVSHWRCRLRAGNKLSPINWSMDFFVSFEETYGNLWKPMVTYGNLEDFQCFHRFR